MSQTDLLFHNGSKKEFNEIKKKKSLLFIEFFFPFYPIKVFKTPYIIALFALLIALSAIFKIVSIDIPEFGISLSISSIPLMVGGWLFGPIIGLLYGAIADNIMFVVKPPIAWFYMYAIASPLLSMASGFFSSIYRIRLTKKNHWIDFIVFQVFTIVFLSFIIIFMEHVITQINLNEKYYNIYKYAKYYSLIFPIIFFAILEISFFINFKIERKLMVIYLSCLAITNAVIFSFLLGTQSAMMYFNYLKIHPFQDLKVQYSIFLLSRIAKESIKTPLELFIIIKIIGAIQPLFDNFLNTINKSHNLNMFNKTIKEKM
ncbi:MAG: ECF transporter S component [Mycoplasmoidaceae bacterium]